MTVSAGSTQRNEPSWNSTMLPLDNGTKQSVSGSYVLAAVGSHGAAPPPTRAAGGVTASGVAIGPAGSDDGVSDDGVVVDSFCASDDSGSVTTEVSSGPVVGDSLSSSPPALIAMTAMM